MSQLHTLARRLMALEDRIVACMKCGLCQAVCPMFGATMREADVARGKMALIDNLAHEVFTDPEALADKLGRCLLCGSCEANCPSGVKIMEIFMEAREIVHAYLGLHPAKKLIFRFLLARPGLFNLAMRAGAPAQSVLFRKSGDEQGTVCAPLLQFMLGDRHIRALAKTPLHATHPDLDEPRTMGGLRVAFFPGCVADKMYVRMGEACLRVLKHHGVSVFMPSDFACCGIPALSSGDAEGMVAQMRHNLRLLENVSVDYIVTPCGSCTSTIKELWPRYAARIDAAAQGVARDVASRTMDINEFLVKVLGVKPAENPVGGLKVTYHDSCHLKKALGIAKEPRDVLRSNPYVTLVEMKEADRCCGCGGSFNLFHYDLSRQIGQRKRDNAVATGAEVVAMGCPACMMQFEDVLSHNQDSMRVKHTMELYAESLNLM